MESRVAGRFVDAGALVTPAVNNADDWNTADYYADYVLLQSFTEF